MGKKYVLNVDLKDFFPQINFGRVRGLFMAPPYKLPPTVATVLAQICCHENQLPQGAPSSPIISNMICAKMDSEFQRLAKDNRCVYSRYADDLTFSTSVPDFPPDLATTRTIDAKEQIVLGPGVKQIIGTNGFEINEEKVRLQTRHFRQQVTGLTVNERPNVKRKYVKQIRAMLHAWEKWDLGPAEMEFSAKYDHKHRKPSKGKPQFRAVVRGKIAFLGMVRGKNDKMYKKFRQQFRILVTNH